MNKTLELVCESLDELSQAVIALSHEQRTLVEFMGWNFPAVTREDLANIPLQLSMQIKNNNIEDISEELENILNKIPQKITLLKTHTLPQLFNGNGAQAIPAYMTTLQWIDTLIQPLLAWQTISDSKMLPPMLAKKLRGLQKQLDEVSIDKDKLIKQISLIQNATETAESLPANLISLKEAREEVSTISTKSISDSKEIESLKNTAKQHESTISEKLIEAEKLINQCEEAYRVTTTKGLAGAFEERAERLSQSMWVWVFGLLTALSVGAIIGSERLALLTQSMKSPHPDTGLIIIQVLLSGLSLGAPLWFAWLATKQIGQRFKLSEDYAFKSSVAKAYEGYRKEASRIDEAFEARLFSTVLTRVEEAPLRLMNEATHGSPWHELISSPEFRNAINQIPEFKDKFLDITKTGISSIKDLKVAKEVKKAQDNIVEEVV